MREVFSEPFFNLEQGINRKVIDRIKLTQKAVFLSNEEEKIKDSLYEEFKLETITLLEHFGEHTESSLILKVPFEGDNTLLSYQPTSLRYSPSFNSPGLDNHEIVYYFKLDSQTSEEQLQRDLNSLLEIIKTNVANLNSDINKFNIQLKEIIKNQVNLRIEEIKKTSDVVSKLDIKLKKRGDAPKTYVIPIKKKRIELVVSKIQTETPSSLEPTLSNQTYEEILNIIENMSLVMERSPSAFINMKEEDLRVHFLVQLNGQYEGEAMGEVFNLEGKTDILIRQKGKNIFIAECKFWKGEKEYLEAIDQLLNYVSWRDTKTSIILFNKNKDSSKVLKQLPEIIKKHTHFINQEKYEKENAFRFVMKNKNDEGKTFILTTKLFDVPIQIS